MKNEVNKYVKEISLTNNIPVKDVEKAISSQFSFVKSIIESAEKNKEETFKIIQLPFFGKFVVNLVALKKMKYYTELKNGNISK